MPPPIVAKSHNRGRFEYFDHTGIRKARVLGRQVEAVRTGVDLEEAAILFGMG